MSIFLTQESTGLISIYFHFLLWSLMISSCLKEMNQNQMCTWKSSLDNRYLSLKVYHISAACIVVHNLQKRYIKTLENYYGVSSFILASRNTEFTFKTNIQGMCVYALNIYIQEACTPIEDVSSRKLTCNDWYNCIKVFKPGTLR